MLDQDKGTKRICEVKCGPRQKSDGGRRGFSSLLRERESDGEREDRVFVSLSFSSRLLGLTHNDYAAGKNEIEERTRAKRENEKS